MDRLLRRSSARFIPTERCLEIASGEDMCTGPDCVLNAIAPSQDDACITHHHETWFLRPDWPSLRLCGFRTSHASVMCFLDQKDATTRFDKCPRDILGKTLERLEKDWSVKVLLGFEIEFVFMDEENKLLRPPMEWMDGHSRTAGLRHESLDMVEEILESLKLSGIRVHQFHTEGGDQQLEIALAPEPAMRAIDSLILAQETIRTIGLRWGVKASMTPKPTLYGASNGLHMHLSLNASDGLADSFVAGVLHHLASLCAFGMANYDGYEQVKRGGGAGAWSGFGTNNTDLPVRKVGHLHWEIRILDATANPYLFTACVLLAALDGLGKEMRLRWKDFDGFPHMVDEAKRIEYGINYHMPVNFEEALATLGDDGVLKSVIGEDLCKWYFFVRDREVKAFGQMSDETRRLRFLGFF